MSAWCGPECLREWPTHLEVKVSDLEESRLLFQYLTLSRLPACRCMDDLVAEWHLHWTTRDLIWAELIDYWKKPRAHKCYLYTDLATILILPCPKIE